MDASKTTKIYDRLAPLYDFWSFLTETVPEQQALRVAALKPGESVLEAALGTGKLFVEVLQTAGLKRCVGVDLSTRMLDRARRRVISLGKSPALCRSDARRLPFADSLFDAVLCCYMLDLLAEEDIRGVLGEFHRILKPGGRLAALVMGEQARVFNAIWMWGYRHAPALVGGCRPVALAPILKAAGWRLDLHERLTQGGFRSELFLARLAGPEARSA
jgi:ubiquinone/menaquinone biosynthesis C-methylase UbiE